MTTTQATRAEGPHLVLGSDGIVRMRYEPGDIVTEDLALATMVEFKSLSGGKRLPVLVDIRLMKSITREARAIFGNAGEAFSALALLAGSPRTQLIANFFMSLSRQKVPRQMFTDEEKAVAWLRRHAV